MRIFSKFTVLCNISFVIAVILRYLEMHNQYESANRQILPLPWMEGTLVILGYGAIIVNTLFLVLCLIFTAFKVSISISIPKWILIFNIVLFCFQVYFFFFLK